MSINRLGKATYLSRGTTHHNPHVLPGTVLPPRETFAAHPDILALYDRFNALSAAMKANNEAAAKARADASAAEQQYHRDVRDAMGSGADPSTVTNRGPELLAQAAALDTLKAEAKAGAVAVGHELAQLIHEAAPDLFAPTEAIMRGAADDVRNAVTHLRTTWANWSHAWHVRRILSQSAYAGGGLNPYNDAAALPPEVAQALDVLEGHLSALDQLQAEEKALRDWRNTEAEAHRRNAQVIARG